MKLSIFVKTLFLHVRLNVLHVKKGSFLVLYSKDVRKAYELGKHIQSCTNAFEGVLVVGDEISVNTVRTIPEEMRNKLIAALLDAGQ